MASESPQLARSLFGYRTSRVRQILADRERMFLLVQGHAQQAQAKVDALQTDLHSVRAKLIEQAESTDAMLTQARAELESATDALRTRNEHVQEAESRVAELTSQLETTQSELETTRAELETTRAELEVQGARSQAAEALTDHLRAELAAARIELAERDRQETARPIAATEELSVILEAAERGVSGIMERTRHAYEDQLAHAERERQAIRSEIDRFGEWQAHIEPRVRSIQQSIETARDRITRIPQQIQDAVGSMAKAITAVSDSLDRLATLPGPMSSIEEAPESVEHPESRSIDLVRLQDDGPGSADTLGTPETESEAPTRPSDPDDPSARRKDPAATDEDPHWATNWGPLRDRGH